MADYMDPGYAASQSIEAMLHRRELAKRQAMLDALAQQKEARLAKSDDLEMDWRRQQLEMQRQDHAAQISQREADRVEKMREKQVGEHLKKREQMAPGDFASPELVKEARDLGVPLALTPAGQREQDTPGFVGPVDPQAVVMGQKYLGNPVQRQAEEDRTKAQGILQDPNTPEPVRQFLGMRLALPKGEAVPYQLFQDKSANSRGQLHPMKLDGKVINAVFDPESKRSFYRGEDITDRAEFYEKPPSPDRVLIQTDTGYVPRADAARTLRGGGEVPLPPSAQERNMRSSTKRMMPVLNSISELSERINTNQGVFAKAVGELEKAKAKINLDDDVAEYNSVISGFTPIVARAVGHVGVLTQQDVDSVKEMFPKPGDSKSLRDRKIKRLEGLLAEIADAGGGGSAPVGAAPPPAGGNRRVRYDVNGNQIP